MNPEENQNNPTPPSTPDASGIAADSLDQVAADLTSAAADGAASMMNISNSPAEATPVQDPILPDAPAAAPAPDAPADTSTDTLAAPAEPPIAEPAADAPLDAPAETSDVPSDTTNTAAQPSFGAVENPDFSDVNPPTSLGNPTEDLSGGVSAEDTSLTGEAPDNTASSDDIAEETPIEEKPDTESPEMTSASFIGDAPKPREEKTDPEDEEPLVPAEPVPGSIGSAMAYSEDAPGHSVPVEKPKKKKLLTKRDEKDDGSVEIGGKKIDSKKILIIVGIIVLIGIIAFVLFFVLGGSSQKKSTTKSTITTTPQSKESSLVCKKEGDGNAFSKYPQVVTGSEEIIVMYKDGILVSFGDNLKLNYETAEIASVRLGEIRSDYSSTYSNLKFTTDPFESAFNAKGTVITVSHQADGDIIDSSNAKVLGIPVLKGEVYSDIDSLQDNYESQGFTCTAK